MAENWTAIAQEAAAAIASVGFPAVLEIPTASTGPEGVSFTTEAITVIDDMITTRDAGGMVTGSTRVLMMQALATAPQKGWRVNVRGQWHRIASVMPLAPGGVDLMFEIELEG